MVKTKKQASKKLLLIVSAFLLLFSCEKKLDNAGDQQPIRWNGPSAEVFIFSYDPMYNGWRYNFGTTVVGKAIPIRSDIVNCTAESRFDKISVPINFSFPLTYYNPNLNGFSFTRNVRIDSVGCYAINIGY